MKDYNQVNLASNPAWSATDIMAWWLVQIAQNADVQYSLVGGFSWRILAWYICIKVTA